MIISFLWEFAIEFPISLALEFCQEVDLVYFIESFIHLGFLFVLEESVNGNWSSFSWQMFSLVVRYSLVIIVETYIFGGQHFETSHLNSMLLGKVNEVLSVLLFGIGVINNNAFSLRKLFVSNFVAFFLCFKSISVDSHVIWQMSCAESRFSWARSSNHNHHLMINILDSVSFANNELTFLRDGIGIEPFDL